MARTLLSAAKVKQYRLRLGLQQTQAAKLAGWQRGQSWHKLEIHNCDVRVSTLATVAAVLHCKIDDLLVRVSGKSKAAARYKMGNVRTSAGASPNHTGQADGPL
ncbi:MAG TPA: helix-turn-helix transcriptional regulator [Tepidisphaeraceae bacterium]|jgi:DNA-binding XRE family transcriptional regulator|nr:helix-turn-helix transcriptional regulator [Tepidisphaeraceae bacterium]